MNRKEIMSMQERIGVEADGFWGPVSIAACQKHLISLCPHNDWPKQRNVEKHFGPHGEPDGSYSPPTKKIILPFPLHLYGDPKRPVKSLYPHEKIADALLNVFARLEEVYPDEASRKASGCMDYYGLYNPRPMRGGRSWSMHAYSIAIDLDAPRNGLNTKWPERARMPLAVMECFAYEGFKPAGAFWLRDAMHFQATT